MDIVDFFDNAFEFARNHYCRYASVIRGSEDWKSTLLSSARNAVEGRAVQLGGTPIDGYEFYSAGKGDMLLGQECHLLYIDLSQSYNANSINAALGIVIGGGVVLFSEPEVVSDNYVNQWLNAALSKLPILDEQASLPELPTNNFSKKNTNNHFGEQQLVVEEMVAVKRRRAHRPLVVTADRGRGKTTAIGLAAAELLSSSACSLVLTAPRWESVKGVFSTVREQLSISEQSHPFVIDYQGSSLRFIAPDALHQHSNETDILFVDEASALPLPTLFSLCDAFSRIVFSTTIHGYEGCGRGFSLKFLSWLKQHKPQYRQISMSQPIRWSNNDAVEHWANDTFLLSPPVRENTQFNVSDVFQQGELKLFSPQQLVTDARLLSDIFYILVDAHYQTSPNDLIHLLSDPAVSIIALVYQEQVLGCVTAVVEPPLSDELAADVSAGRRRPKGHLTPVTFLNQLGVRDGASVAWYRIMRIALLPELQSQGLGSFILSKLSSVLGSDFLSTSFGATSELVKFWMNNHFIPVKMGTQKDQASGCFSLLMIHRQCLQYDWAATSFERFKFSLPKLLSRELQQLDLMTSMQLLESGSSLTIPDIPFELLHNYSIGGSNYESVSVWLEEFFLSLSVEQRSVLGEVFLLKVLKNLSWSDCADTLNLSGRKAVESLLREHLQQILKSDIYSVN